MNHTLQEEIVCGQYQLKETKEIKKIICNKCGRGDPGSERMSPGGGIQCGSDMGVLLGEGRRTPQF